MKLTNRIEDLKKEDIENQKNRAAINGFRDNLSLGAVLERAYITPRYHLHKHGIDCTGISRIVEEYNARNIIFVGDGGTGKTSAFLRLYIGADPEVKKLTDKQFYYFFSPDLIGNFNSLNGYQKAIRKAIESEKAIDGILLLDGLEEAYANNGKSASEVIKKLKRAGTTFWVSCRSSFYERLDDIVFPFFSERVTIDAWTAEDFDVFVDNCLKEDRSKDIIKEKVGVIGQKVESLIKRPLFATMILFVAEDPGVEDIQDEYELIELFLNKWIKRESEEKGITYDKEKSYNSIREIALRVYLKTKKRPKLSKDALVFRDLLVMSNTSTNATIHGFSHREFLVYFIVNALIDAARDHPDRIVWWYSQTFYDDITNLIKPVLLRMNWEENDKIFKNLFSVYRQTYEATFDVSEKMVTLGLSPKEDFLKLRDEILYFILKIPNVDHEAFTQYAYSRSTDVMLFLGIAYGMAQIDPNNSYTLEFAKKLTPGSEEERRNRGWGMCFFGDVEGEDGYTYQDNQTKPWKKIRENRLRRLSDDKKNHVSRVLDLPLLYCFYYSRGFRDCTSYSDYRTILNTNTSLDCFGKEQQAFMNKQKELLVSMYRNQLLLEELNSRRFGVGLVAKRGRIIVNHNTNKINLEIDDDLAERILRQIAHRESVYKNLHDFWTKKGAEIIENYSTPFVTPKPKQLTPEKFEEKIKTCKVLIISANRIEGITITRRLLQESGVDCLDSFPSDNQIYQFATIGSIPVVHIWPIDTSSFTQYGSFCAIDAALERFAPKYVFSVGVAFGIDPTNQSLGDVLASRSLVFYDNFNKVTDGNIKLKQDEVCRIAPILESQLHQLESQCPPDSVGHFKWHYGAMLTGGTVLSDAEEKDNLIDGAKNIGREVIGGEMEASGVYYACQKIKNRNYPFMIVKGICDWGAEKNSWNQVLGPNYNGDEIKDRIQAYACNNAFNTLRFILSQLNMDL